MNFYVVNLKVSRKTKDVKNIPKMSGTKQQKCLIYEKGTLLAELYSSRNIKLSKHCLEKLIPQDSPLEKQTGYETTKQRTITELSRTEQQKLSSA